MTAKALAVKKFTNLQFVSMRFLLASIRRLRKVMDFGKARRARRANCFGKNKTSQRTFRQRGRLNPSLIGEKIAQCMALRLIRLLSEEEIAPVADALNSGFLHENDIPDSLKAYF